jgi:hypothetical protein
MKKFCLSVLGVFIASILAIHPAVSENLKEEKDQTKAEWAKLEQEKRKFSEDRTYILDGNGYSRAQLIGDFVQAAFLHYTWAEVGYNKGWASYANAKDNILYSQMLKHPYPWLAEFILRNDGSPKFDSISRWSRPVTVGFGYPAPEKYQYEGGADQQSRFQQEQFIEKVKSVITGLSEDIKSVTGQPLQFIERQDETAQHYARLRIIPYGFGTSEFHHYKFGTAISNTLLGVTQEGDLPTESYITHLHDAARFTPTSKTQVEGYFVADKNNNVDFSACYIPSDVKDENFAPLVAECVLRALGFPDMTLANRKTLLGHWNETHVKSTKRSFPWMCEKQEDPLDSRPNPEAETRFRAGRPTEYDLALLSLLYCKDIRLGMSRYEVMDLLDKTDGCFIHMPK